MLNTGKCPQCSETIQHVKMERIYMHEGLMDPTKWKGISSMCPKCDTILSVAVDPLTLQDVLLDKLKKLLGQ